MQFSLQHLKWFQDKKLWKVKITIQLSFHFHAKHQSVLNQEYHLILPHNLAWPTKWRLRTLYRFNTWFFSLKQSDQSPVAQLLTFSHLSERFDGEYPASTSNVFTIIPSHEERRASSRKAFILVNVASQVKQASSASTYI